MSGLQRDHSVNENWTNSSGYNDGTAGAALNNIMRQQRQERGTSVRSVQVEHYKTAPPAPAKPKAKPTLPAQKSPDELELKSVRTVYVVFAAIASMQGLSIDAITLRSKASGRTYEKSELAPPPKKKGEIG